MANSFFKFKQFTVHQEGCAMKIATDSCLFGAWCAMQLAEESRIDERLLDIGTGTGLLALQIAQKNKLLIEAVELDKAAADQAKANVASSPWQHRIQVYNKDILAWPGNRHYKYIVSNPPFYEEDLASPDSKKNLAHHSTQLNSKALFVFIKTHLIEGGCFFLLLPFRRKTEIYKLLEQFQLSMNEMVAVRHSPKHAPSRLLLSGTSGQPFSPPRLSELSIKDDNDNYSNEFTGYLKDYYLHL